MIRDDVAQAEQETFRTLVESLVDSNTELEPIEDDKVNQDLYKIGLLGTKDTLEDVISKVNEIVVYLNKNLGV